MSKRRARNSIIHDRPAYYKYIQSPEWEAKKNHFRASKLCTGKCNLCMRPGRWDIHHKTYKRLFREYAGDLLELCPICHKTVHKYAQTLPNGSLWCAVKKPRRLWKHYADSNNLWGLLKTDPRRYSVILAGFLHVDMADPFVARLTAPQSLLRS